MGTAGALSLLPTKPTEPFFVMNGDLLTTIEISNDMLNFRYRKIKQLQTMGVRE